MAQQAFSPDTCDQTIKIQLFSMEGGDKTGGFDGWILFNFIGYTWSPHYCGAIEGVQDFRNEGTLATLKHLTRNFKMFRTFNTPTSLQHTAGN